VVLLADWNADVRGEKTRKYMANLSMREVIMEFHGAAGPRRYMPFGMGIGSDHRCLWLDIRTRVFMGQ
jgi:hypothetical protein